MRTIQEVNSELDALEKSYHAGGITDESYNSDKEKLRLEQQTISRAEGARQGEESAKYYQRVNATTELIKTKAKDLAVRLYGENPSQLFVTGAMGSINAHYNKQAMDMSKEKNISFADAFAEVLHGVKDEDLDKLVEQVYNENKKDGDEKKQAAEKKEAKTNKGDPKKTHEEDANEAKEAAIEDGTGGSSITPDGESGKDAKTISDFLENPDKNKFTENLGEFGNFIEAAARQQAQLDGSQAAVFVKNPDGTKTPIGA